MYKITKQEDIINYVRTHDYTYRLIVLKDKRFAACGRNKTFRIYKMNPIQFEVSIITRHSKENTDICELDDENIASYSEDCSIRFFTPNQVHTSYQCTKEIKKVHSQYIQRIISMKNKRITTCARDGNIIIRNIDDTFSVNKILHTISAM